MKRLALGLVLALATPLLAAAPAAATEWHITTCEEGQEQWLQYAMQVGTTVIVYDVPCTVTLTRPLDVRSGVTIQATQPVTFTGNYGPYAGFKIHARSGVVLRNLTIREFGIPAQRSQNNPHDCIDILGSTNVVLEHLTISQCGDKQVSIMGGSTAYLRWNRFVGDPYHAQFVQVGAQFYASTDSSQMVRSTLNWFEGDGYRMPNVSYGKMHSWNNLFDRPYASTQCQRGAQCIFENDVWIPKATCQTMIKYEPDGSGCNDDGDLCDDTPGAGRVSGAWLQNGAKAPSYNPSSVFIPTYRYSAVAANQSLVDNVKATAGAH
jgi:pectate lyase